MATTVLIMLYLLSVYTSLQDMIDASTSADVCFSYSTYFVGASLDALTNDIKNLKASISKQDHVLSLKRLKPWRYFYNYPNSTRTALKDIDIIIPAKSTIGIVGATEVENQQLLILLGLLS